MSKKIEMHRGTITDNALKALVTSPVFKAKVERNKKGKGAYQRKEKSGKGWEANRKLR
ncbi:MAG: alternative ribosome rescue factor ArfA [Plesiomonas sp.]|uniref:alternative ribosome rescue factor ArfA n=1 Tax=Plesiomonas sp. TaxID=2486279 RepID=UPI003EE5D0BB